MAATRVFTAHVPAGLADKVDALATRMKRSRGWIVKQALAAWVDQEEERHTLTLQALADVDAGRVSDHLSIQAWADSLTTDHPLPPPALCEGKRRIIAPADSSWDDFFAAPGIDLEPREQPAVEVRDEL